ncbi:hypothetical protein F4604DRAFT_1922256 [Suillus subluteus]|nr:hypothetical protein F4604DRAFT_1922256 [Suillus subluteus]
MNTWHPKSPYPAPPASLLCLCTLFAPSCETLGPLYTSWHAIPHAPDTSIVSLRVLIDTASSDMFETGVAYTTDRSNWVTTGSSLSDMIKVVMSLSSPLMSTHPDHPHVS